ncbi:MAG: protein-L-isoaspartate O-methyltransferase [Alphaproteobacteria bacterium]|nr:protein-L-isoaspartate O-methyltransferase [Alphaproteobacteria bacterium]
MPLFEAARLHMIESQLRPNRVIEERLLDAVMRTRRELFVPEALRSIAYADADLPLGDGRFLMNPMVSGKLLQAVAPERKDTALVVGAGVGYEAAVLAQLVRKVIAVEENEALARIGRSALVDHHIGSVTYVESAARAGCRQNAPYDVILFGGAVEEIPSEITDQLGERGRLAVVLRPQGGIGRATLITGTGGSLARRVIFDAGAPLLPGFVARPEFVF